MISLGSIQFFEAGEPDDVIKLSPMEIAVLLFAAPPKADSLESPSQPMIDDLTGRALGRVLAHEVGHYLLASRSHARQGLMRPSYRRHELAGWNRDGF